ncbi:MAG TPA: sugar phosphate isomerase/epimerase [Pirellulales bacterium]|jgi:sugar phosphate isomerase/epimerase|nr:sugar phosphate isomerase/epimerase [Pirellulales bacterium]
MASLTRRAALKFVGTGIVLGAAARPLDRASGAEPAAAPSAPVSPGAPGSPTVAATAADPRRSAKEPFGYCLNTATIRGQKLPLVAELDIAAKAGYHAVEPWFSEIEDYQKKGGTLPDLKKRLADLNLTMESAIAFPEWLVDDEAKRTAAIELAKKQMGTLQQVGGKRLACPPAGATNVENMSLHKITARYRALLELGEKMNVVPELEVWGFSKTLGRLSEAAAVVIECGHPQACILPDVFHLYKGGSDFNGMRFLSGQALHVLHMNDYPDQPGRDKVTDAERVYPGDGVAPLKMLFRNLRMNGYTGYLSLELFNRTYWEQDALLVARTALEKTRIAVLSAWE